MNIYAFKTCVSPKAGGEAGTAVHAATRGKQREEGTLAERQESSTVYARSGRC